MILKKITVLISSLLLLFSPVILAAENRGMKLNIERLALVIGNSDYQTAPLDNPLNDAEDMAATLKNLGFRTILKKNADQRTMEDAIRFFGKELRRGGVGLFYFAGHGMQVEGRNYLIPIDARIESENDVKYEAVDAGRVLGQMEDAQNQINIVILDACRNNPFSRNFRTSERGLARMDAPKGSLIAYATAPGEVAADGLDRNGVFTKYLMKHMIEPNMPIELVLKQARIDVARETGGRQIPWESSSLMGNFYFNSSKSVKTVQHFDSNVPASTQKAKVAALPKTNLKPERKDSQFKIAVFPIYVDRTPWEGPNSQTDVNNTAIDSFRKVFETNKMWNPIYSYYEMGEKFNTKMLDKSIITNKAKSELWIKGNMWSKKKLNVDLIYHLGTKLKIDFAVTYAIYYNDLVWDSSIYIIDVINKEVYSKSKSFDVISFHSHFPAFSKQVFSSYETEINPDNAYGKQVAVITDDFERSVEPWTGIWEVEGFRDFDGKWALKQTDKTVVSTRASFWEVKGVVQGNQLKGKIKADHGQTHRFIISISSDGQSFEGKIDRISSTSPIKGKRIK